MDRKEQKKAYREEQKKAYREANKDKIKAYNKAYNEANKDKIKETNKLYREANKPTKVKKVPTNIKEYKRAYYQANKDKLRETINKWHKKERDTNPLFKLKGNIRNLIGNTIRRGGFKKMTKTEQILGCTFQQFKEHLESQFEPWMTWDNRGLYNGTPNYGWDIDHIKPTSSANNELELLQLNHYSNLKPLCSYINRDVKRNTI